MARLGRLYHTRLNEYQNRLYIYFIFQYNVVRANQMYSYVLYVFVINMGEIPVFCFEFFWSFLYCMWMDIFTEHVYSTIIAFIGLFGASYAIVYGRNCDVFGYSFSLLAKEGPGG